MLVLFSVVPAMMILGFYHLIGRAGAFAARGQKEKKQQKKKDGLSHELKSPKNSTFCNMP
jgi:hypothetical protein